MISRLNINEVKSSVEGWLTVNRRLDPFLGLLLSMLLFGIIAPFNVHANEAVFKGLVLDQTPSRQVDMLWSTDDPSRITQTLSDQMNHQLNELKTLWTVPLSDIWVNLNPVEPHRLMGPTLRDTTVGATILAQDLLLKQTVTELLHPATVTGDHFWSTLLFNNQDTEHLSPPEFKVWIVPASAQLNIDHHRFYIHDLNLAVQTESAQHRRNALEPLAALSPVLETVTDKINHAPAFSPIRSLCRTILLKEWLKTFVHSTPPPVVSEVRREQINQDIQSIYQHYLQLHTSRHSGSVFEIYQPSTQTLTKRTVISGGFTYTNPQLILKTKPQDDHNLIVTLAPDETNPNNGIPNSFFRLQQYKVNLQWDQLDAPTQRFLNAIQNLNGFEDFLDHRKRFPRPLSHLIEEWTNTFTADFVFGHADEIIAIEQKGTTRNLVQKLLLTELSEQFGKDFIKQTEIWKNLVDWATSQNGQRTLIKLKSLAQSIGHDLIKQNWSLFLPGEPLDLTRIPKDDLFALRHHLNFQRTDPSTYTLRFHYLQHSYQLIQSLTDDQKKDVLRELFFEYTLSAMARLQHPKLLNELFATLEIIIQLSLDWNERLHLMVITLKSVFTPQLTNSDRQALLSDLRQTLPHSPLDSRIEEHLAEHLLKQFLLTIGRDEREYTPDDYVISAEHLNRWLNTLFIARDHFPLFLTRTWQNDINASLATLIEPPVAEAFVDHITRVAQGTSTPEFRQFSHQFIQHMLLWITDKVPFSPADDIRSNIIRILTANTLNDAFSPPIRLFFSLLNNIEGPFEDINKQYYFFKSNLIITFYTSFMNNDPAHTELKSILSELAALRITRPLYWAFLNNGQTFTNIRPHLRNYINENTAYWNNAYRSHRMLFLHNANENHYWAGTSLLNDKLIKDYRQQGIDVVYIEVHEEQDLLNVINHIKIPHQAFDDLWINTHASQTIMVFNKDLAIGPPSHRYLRRIRMRNLLKNHGRLFIIGCSVGEGCDQQDNMVNLFTGVFDQADSIVGSVGNTRVPDVDVDLNGFNIQYVDTEKNQNLEAYTTRPNLKTLSAQMIVSLDHIRTTLLQKLNPEFQLPDPEISGEPYEITSLIARDDHTLLNIRFDQGDVAVRVPHTADHNWRRIDALSFDRALFEDLLNDDPTRSNVSLSQILHEWLYDREELAQDWGSLDASVDPLADSIAIVNTPHDDSPWHEDLDQYIEYLSVIQNQTLSEELIDHIAHVVERLMHLRHFILDHPDIRANLTDDDQELISQLTGIRTPTAQLSDSSVGGVDLTGLKLPQTTPTETLFLPLWGLHHHGYQNSRPLTLTF
jgi:hypothetical protein